MYTYRSYNKVPRYHGVSILTVQLDWLLKEKPLEKQRLIICRSVVNRELMHSGTSAGKGHWHRRTREAVSQDFIRVRSDCPMIFAFATICRFHIMWVKNLLSADCHLHNHGILYTSEDKLKKSSFCGRSI